MTQKEFNKKYRSLTPEQKARKQEIDKKIEKELNDIDNDPTCFAYKFREAFKTHITKWQNR